MKRVFLLAMLCGAAHAAAPVLFYSDLTDGPRTGGENAKGAYVCVYGRNFGASRGGSTISIGGTDVDNYPVWGSGNAPARSDDKACFQLGTSVPTGAQSIVMTVDGTPSNALAFYVRADASDVIYCAATDGNDSNDGHFSTNGEGGTGCYLQPKNAMFFSADSSIVYISGLANSPMSGGSYMTIVHSGAPNAIWALVGYPGASNTVGVINGTDYAASVDIAGTSGYVTLAGLNMVQGGGLALKHIGISSPVRYVGNTIQCPYGTDAVGCANISQSQNIHWLGNHAYNVSDLAPAASVAGLSGGQTLTNMVVDGAGVVTATVEDTTNWRTGESIAVRGSSDTNLNSTFTIATIPGSTTFTFSCVSCTPSTTHNEAGLYFTARENQQHSVYFTTDTNNWEVAYSEFGPDWACRSLEIHSSPLGSSQGSFNLYPPSTTLNDSNHTFVSTVAGGALPGRTYYVAYSYENVDSGCGVCNVGETTPSNWIAVTVAANHLLKVNSPNTGTFGGYVTTATGYTAGVSHWNVYLSTTEPNDPQLSVMDKQNASPVALGADWTEPGTGITTGAAPLIAGSNTTGYVTGFNLYGISIHHNLFHDLRCDAFAFATVDPQRGAVAVHDNVFYNIGLGGLGGDAAKYAPSSGLYSGSAAYLPAGTNTGANGLGTISVYNNTVYNSGVATGGATQAGFTGAISAGHSVDIARELTDNIFQTVGAEPYIATATGDNAAFADKMTGTTNIFYGNGSGPSAITYPNLAASANDDPLFTDATAYDFTLLPGSPAIDAGAASASTTDYLGATRPNPPSIGAFEPTTTDPTVTPATLPSGTVGAAYSQTLTASNFGGTVTWTVLSGSLPTGLSGCNSVTGVACSITGTPSTTSGSPFSFTIRATDGSDTVDTPYTVTIAAASPSTSTGARSGSRVSSGSKTGNR